MKNEKGITLIALVITIIVLLILAGISIAMLTGDNGLLTKSKESAAASAVAGAKDEITLAFQEKMADYLKNKYTAGATAVAPIPSTVVAAISGRDHDCTITPTDPTGTATTGTIVISYPKNATTPDYTTTGTIDTANLTLTWSK